MKTFVKDSRESFQSFSSNLIVLEKLSENLGNSRPTVSDLYERIWIEIFLVAPTVLLTVFHSYCFWRKCWLLSFQYIFRIKGQTSYPAFFVSILHNKQFSNEVWKMKLELHVVSEASILIHRDFKNRSRPAEPGVEA